MQNSFMLGVRHRDTVNLKVSMFVIGIFGIITIISYINELGKAGLLTRGGKAYRHYKLTGKSLHHNDALIQKNGNIHQLGLDITKIRQFIHGKKLNDTKGAKSESNEINIAVRLEKNNSYQKVNNTGFSIYQHQNVLPNYYTSLSVNLSMSNFHMLNGTAGIKLTKHDMLKGLKEVHRILDLENKRRAKYKNSTMVLLYQHEPSGFFVRKCLTDIARKYQLAVPSVPLNAVTRKEWEIWGLKKKSSFKFLFGSLSFGICEDIIHPCIYFTMLLHPIDRILILYHVCSNDASSIYCRFPNSKSVHNMTILDFVKSQGNNLFQKLLYYSRHCRLVGDDEICVHDSQTTFLMTPQEREIHLDHVLQNLENWFAVVGLQEYFHDSLKLFQDIFGFPFPDCASLNATNTKIQLHLKKHIGSPVASQWFGGIGEEKYMKTRETILNNILVQKWLHADLLIYSKFKEIFQKQMQKHQDIALTKERYNRLSAKVKTRRRHKEKGSHKGSSSPVNNKVATFGKVDNVGKDHSNLSMFLHSRSLLPTVRRIPHRLPPKFQLKSHIRNLHFSTDQQLKTTPRIHAIDIGTPENSPNAANARLLHRPGQNLGKVKVQNSKNSRQVKRFNHKKKRGSA